MMRVILSFSNGSIFLSFVLILTAILVTRCTKPGEFTIGNDFVDPQTKLSVVDTFKVNVSTIIIDSLITSSTKLAYVGNYRDTVFGSVRCESYFDVAYAELAAPGDKAVFDSAAFLLTYSKYSYGDTTSSMTLTVHELTENVTPKVDGNLYNNSSFSYAQAAVGSLTFHPSPNSVDTLLRVPANNFGDRLFELIKTGDVRISDEDQFTDYIKGFVLVADSTDSNVVLGFKADAGHIMLKIYYHFDDAGPAQKDVTINMGIAGHQFNNVRSDFSGTPLSNIREKRILSSDQTGNRAFMQGLTGLLPKFQFPTFQNLFLEQRWKILRAQLIIEPVANSYGLFPLPKNMYIYDTNKSNILQNILTDSQGNYLKAVFFNDEYYNEDTRYVYEITNFINSEISDLYFDPNHALAAGLNESGIKSSLDRLVVECKKPAVQLKVYYLSY